MANITLNTISYQLEMATNINIILPHDRTRSDKPCKVLYLLHGLSDNNTAWTRYTALERYVFSRNVAVIMPEVQRSFYTDMKYGLKYFSYISEELPKLCKSMFNISDKPEDTYIAGLSMGGYGAMKAAFTDPANFAGVGAFSSVCDMGKRIIGSDLHINQIYGILGENPILPKECDLYYLTEQAQKSKKAPELFMTCGEEDALFGENLDLKVHMEKLNMSNTYKFWHGDHCWEFWDKSIQLFLDHFNI